MGKEIQVEDYSAIAQRTFSDRKRTNILKKAEQLTIVFLLPKIPKFISLKSFGTLILQKVFQIDYRIGRLITDSFVSYGFNYPLIKYWVFKTKQKQHIIKSN